MNRTQAKSRRRLIRKAKALDRYRDRSDAARTIAVMNHNGIEARSDWGNNNATRRAVGLDPLPWWETIWLKWRTFKAKPRAVRT